MIYVIFEDFIESIFALQKNSIMKKLALSIFTVCALSFTPVLTIAKTNPRAAIAHSAATSDTAGLSILKNRLLEIGTLDKSNLSFVEKKALRKEVKGIEKRMKAMGQYIYISAATLILIIILLIILL